MSGENEKTNVNHGCNGLLNRLLDKADQLGDLIEKFPKLGLREES